MTAQVPDRAGISENPRSSSHTPPGGLNYCTFHRYRVNRAPHRAQGAADAAVLVLQNGRVLIQVRFGLQAVADCRGERLVAQQLAQRRFLDRRRTLILDPDDLGPTTSRAPSSRERAALARGNATGSPRPCNPTTKASIKGA